MTSFFGRPVADAMKFAVCCKKCDKELKNLDIALYKKMVNRGATEYLCIDCLGEKLGVTREFLLEKAEIFKKNGCTLF